MTEYYKWYRLVLDGDRTIDQVPKAYRTEVIRRLEESGHGELAEAHDRQLQSWRCETMTEWEVVGVLITLVSFVAIFVGSAWKFGSMITKLETLIENLSQTIDRIEMEQKEDKQVILNRIDDHDMRLRQVEKEIIRIGDKHNE